VVLAADCVASSLGDFHREHLKGKSLAIACPKLDTEQEIYRQKIKAWFEDTQINTLEVMIMQVPCCMGLQNLVQQAAVIHSSTIFGTGDNEPVVFQANPFSRYNVVHCFAPA